MKGVLVRVGIDASCGFWNAPIDLQTGRFVYVPIPETDEKLHSGLIHTYDEVIPALHAFGVPLPSRLKGQPMHLDPDFEMLTYGDVWPRSSPLLGLRSGDFLAFYSSFQPVVSNDNRLVYALIGLYTVKEVVAADDVPRARWHENAHTRRVEHRREIVVRAITGTSGRFDKAIPIGEWRSRSYRVTQTVLEAWGGLTVKDGYLQRSGRLPEFMQPDRFLEWIDNQGRKLLHSNNPAGKA